VGRIPEIYLEASCEDEVPPGATREDHYRSLWQIVHDEVEHQFTCRIEESKPRCEVCGRTVETLFSMWDEDKRETLRLCYEDYTELEKKRLELMRDREQSS
jgi:hypothetical protein